MHVALVQTMALALTKSIATTANALERSVEETATCGMIPVRQCRAPTMQPAPLEIIRWRGLNATAVKPDTRGHCVSSPQDCVTRMTHVRRMADVMTMGSSTTALATLVMQESTVLRISTNAFHHHVNFPALVKTRSVRINAFALRIQLGSTAKQMYLAATRPA